MGEMNDVFSWKRFFHLLKKALLERPVQTFGFTGLILALTLITYFIIRTQMGLAAAQILTFIWGLTGGGAFLASMAFAYFSSNANGSSYLSLPASQFEKWLCAFIIAMILYPIVYLLFFRTVDATFVELYHRGLDPESPLYKREYDDVQVFSFVGWQAIKVYPIFLILSSAAQLGSLYFNKAPFIKTALWFCGICLGLFLINWLFAVILFGKIDGAVPFRSVDILVGKEVGSVELPKIIFVSVQRALWYAIPALFWILSLVRLREKEF